jgi:hypothetical protein
MGLVKVISVFTGGGDGGVGVCSSFLQLTAVKTRNPNKYFLNIAYGDNSFKGNEGNSK